MLDFSKCYMMLSGKSNINGWQNRELLTGTSVMTDFRRRILYFVYLMHQINKCLGLQLGKGLIVYQFQLSLLWCWIENWSYVFQRKSLVHPPQWCGGTQKKTMLKIESISSIHILNFCQKERFLAENYLLILKAHREKFISS